MTLIASYQKNNVILMVGDLLVSGKREQNSPLDIPTRFSELQPSANLLFTQLSQKVVIINDHLAVAWAGSKIVAKYLIERIAAELSKPYSGKQILELIHSSELLEEEIKSVSFIFFGLTDDGFPNAINIFVQDYLTGETILDHQEKFKYAGSGTYHFFDSIGFNFTEAIGPINEFEMAVSSIVGRLAIALYEEVVSDITHNYYYGGGFELLFFNGNERRFAKLPITFVFWQYDSESVSLAGPIISQEYDTNGFLFLNRVSRNEKGEWGLKRYAVANIINEGRHDPLFPTPPNLDTLITVHYFTPLESDNAVRMMIKKEDSAKKSIAIKYISGENTINVELSPEFMDEVRIATQ